MIEGSKSFATRTWFMTVVAVPTAAARTCRTEQDAVDGARRVRIALRGQKPMAWRTARASSSRATGARPWSTRGPAAPW